MHWCGFWPYRMSTNPFAAPPSEAKREAARNMAARSRQARSHLDENTDGDSSDDSRDEGLIPCSADTASTSPAGQCTDLARERIKVDVVTNDDVPIRISNQKVVAEHSPLSGSRISSTATAAEASSILPAHAKSKSNGHLALRHRVNQLLAERGADVRIRVPDSFGPVTFYNRSMRSLAKMPHSTTQELE
jgi:hypothetical protein